MCIVEKHLNNMARSQICLTNWPENWCDKPTITLESLTRPSWQTWSILVQIYQGKHLSGYSSRLSSIDVSHRRFPCSQPDTLEHTKWLLKHTWKKVKFWESVLWFYATKMRFQTISMWFSSGNKLQGIQSKVYHPINQACWLEHHEIGFILCQWNWYTCANEKYYGERKVKEEKEWKHQVVCRKTWF